ncbi:MAG: fumarate hydratase C-terminal domain-containing protein [Methanophagales archaeon]|nr:fumarate hydratase C-terminal domain-containing protein [Methanophagales archaeon]
MKKRLRTPLEEGEIKQLRLGDIVYLRGEVYTARDKAHHRIREYENAGREKEIPIKKGSVIYHCGPLVQRSKDNGEWEIIAAGPTTSARMDETTPKVIEKLGIRGIIGKGGMDTPAREAMRKCGCVYFSMPGGAAVLAATRIKAVKAVYWEDLGMAEAVWHLLVEDFGPLVVSIDANGNSLYEKIEEEARSGVIATSQSVIAK